MCEARCCRISLLPVNLFIASLLGTALIPTAASAQVLVDNPFVHDYSGWVDAFPAPTRLGNWRLNLLEPTLMNTNNANPPTPDSAAVAHTGIYEPDVLVQNNFLAPAAYTYSTTMRTSDDDIMGIVWNYQDPNNYFRMGLRQQASGNFGGTQGISVQKVVNGVLTQLIPSTPMPGNASPITTAMMDNREAFNLSVAVNGTSYEVFFNGTSIASGVDTDLAAGSKVGFQSWAQAARSATINRFYGTEVDSLTVTSGANTLYSETFNRRPPTQWRQVVMTAADGTNALSAGASKELLGNFGLDINDPWIQQDSNGFRNATVGNIDFIGPGIAVNNPGSTAFSNYQMQVRIGAGDNDGMGVLVRVQDDNNFYRVTFTNEATGGGGTRAPRGMTVHKVRNGTWTELYRDDSAPLFVYPANAAGTNPDSPGFNMFDLSVGAVGNALKIQVRDHNGNVVNYPVIVDSSDPILTGSVGLQTWGTEDVYYMGYGGTDTPLLTTLSAFTDFDVVVDRGTGNITLTNNGAGPVNVKGVSILSEGGGLNPATWLSIANNYDRPAPPTPGNGSVDANDAWTITSSLSTNLSEEEQAGNGGTLGVGQSVNFGNAWIKSRIEDVVVQIDLTGGSVANAAVSFAGTPWHRSDLNTDGLINVSDWQLFFPNLLSDMSSLTDVQRALAGDINGDGENNVVDFGLFKEDFDAANGAGAFNAMLASVPEPGSLVLLAVSALMAMAFRRSRRGATSLSVIVCASLLTGTAGTALAVPADLTTFTPEPFIPAAGFPTAIWTITPNSATLNSNADASVLYSPDSALNKRFLGRLTPGTDDDVIGFVLGFDPGDSQVSSSADYLLIDWKGATQNDFQFNDGDPANFFHHDQTAQMPGYDMPVGLALSRVSGSPTADEFWAHIDAPENPTGGVTELGRGVTLGSAPYNRTGGSHVFDIRYSPTNVTVLVDGVVQFNQSGSFPDGRFGIYSAWQGPPPTFSNFEVVPLTGFEGLSATVDRSNGNITLRNNGTVPVQFDYYEFDSAGNSLNPAGWTSLHDQNFQSIGPGAGQQWQEAGGSSASDLGEAFLQSTSTFAAGQTVSLGAAYNNSINAEDLVLTFRLASGLVLPGTVNYIGVAPGIAGDFNDDGKVDAADYVVWRKTDGTQPGYNAWRMNFGLNAGSGASLAGAANVPEPASVGIALCLTIVGFGRCMRQRVACRG